SSAAPTTTTSSEAPTTTTSSEAPTTTTSSEAPTTTTSSAAPTTTTSSAAPTTTTSSAAPTTTSTSAAPTTTATSAAPTTTTSSAAPTTTTSSAAPTTTSTSSTTTTTLGALSLKYTTAPGTSSCGGTSLSPGPTAPFSGEIDSDTACTAKIADLGSSCLYIGGGANGAVPNPAIASLASCNLNVVASDASGTGNPATGDATVDIPLQTRVYITANNGSPCPKCNCGTPPCSGSGATGCTFGPSKGGACSTSSTTGNPATSNTSQDCPPEVGGGLFNGALAVELNPLTTGSASVTNISGTGSGNFCAGQVHAGAFGQRSTQCITETGMAAGDLTDGAPHAAREGVVFCIPA